MDKLMSQKEVKRTQVLDRLKAGKISLQEAARQMGVTSRHARRLSRKRGRGGERASRVT